jgi:hypothetical protein
LGGFSEFGRPGQRGWLDYLPIFLIFTARAAWAWKIWLIMADAPEGKNPCKSQWRQKEGIGLMIVNYESIFRYLFLLLYPCLMSAEFAYAPSKNKLIQKKSKKIKKF